jgi:hypothetical protein
VAVKDLEWTVVDILSHELVVEGTLAFGRIHRPEVIGHVPGATHMGTVATPLPEQKLEDSFGIDQVGLGPGMPLGKGHGFVTRKGAIRAFHTENQGNGACGFRLGNESPIGQHSGSEGVIQGWKYGGFHQTEGFSHRMAPVEGKGGENEETSD